MRFKTGARYEGMWLKGRMHGKGMYMWPSGEKYEGEWVNGERNGTGVTTYVNGESHDGMYVANKKQGPGWWKVSAAKMRPGEWRGMYSDRK